MTNDPFGFGQVGADSSIGADAEHTANAPFRAQSPRLRVPRKPPVAWLLASAAAAVIGGLLAGLLGGDLLFAGIGWLLGGPAALLLLAIFTWRETERRSQSTALVFGWTNPARIGVLVLALLAVLVSAVRIAFWSGRNLDLFG